MDNINNNISVLPSIKVIQKLIDSIGSNMTYFLNKGPDDDENGVGANKQKTLSYI